MKKIDSKKLSRLEDKMLQAFLRTIADGNRMKIISFLGKESFTVTEIHKKLKLPQNLASHHISKLKKMELLKEKKEGTFRFYSLNFGKMREYVRLFKRKIGV